MPPIRLDETEDIIDICLDNVFKAVFTKNTPESRGALTRLVSAVIGRDLESVEVVENEPPADSVADRQIRYDLHCRATKELVNIEMTVNPDRFEPVRLEFHAGKLFTGQDIRGVGKSYRDLEEAYQIAFLVKKRFFPDNEFLHTFEYYDPVNHVPLKGRSRIITVELAKTGSVIEKPVEAMMSAERWAAYFRYLTKQDKRSKINEIIAQEEGIAMASQVLVKISRNEQERARLVSEYKYIVDTQSKMVEAERTGIRKGLRKGRQEGLQKGIQEGLLKGKQEGIQEGLQKGIQEGLLKGMQEGVLKGMQEGVLKGKLEVARGLRASGIPLDKIALVTGLSPDEIAAL
jgi:predicted transposase/invertase (TIGR01784 family)